MAGVLRVFPHPTGPWLVRVGRVNLGVPRDIGLRLQELDGVKTTPDDWRDQLGRDGSHEALVQKLEEGLHKPPFSWRSIWQRANPVWLRLPLIPASVMRRAAKPTRRLTRSRYLVLLGIMGILGGVWPYLVSRHLVLAPLTTPGLALGIMIFLISALLHELGHAAALQAEGYEPGGLGLGLLYVLPVMFVDVTPVALLPPAGRLRVNIAGPLFQLAFAAVCQGAWMWLPLPPVLQVGFQIAAGSATLAVSWSLWPFIRSDGYWLVCDALGIAGLDRPLPEGLSRVKRTLVSGLRGANMGFLLLVGGLLTRSLVSRSGVLEPERISGSGHGILLVVIVFLVLAGFWFGLLSRVFYFARRLRADCGA